MDRQAGDDGLAEPKPPVRSSFKADNPALLVILLFPFLFLAFISFFLKSCGNQTLPTTTADAATRDTHQTACGLDPEAIDSFPTFLYSEVKHLKIGNRALECAVCLNEFEDTETLRMMPPCCHVFHPYCIDVWLFSHSTCPVCRTNLVPKPGESLHCTIELDITASAGNPEPEQEQERAITQRRGSECTDMSLMNSTLWTNSDEPSRSRSTNASSWQINRILPRSHSTGHSPVQPDDNMERFTLRLPEEVRNRVLMKRIKSQTLFGQARSSTKGYRSGSVGEEGRLWSSSSSSTQEGFGHKRAFSFLCNHSNPVRRGVGFWFGLVNKWYCSTKGITGDY